MEKFLKLMRIDGKEDVTIQIEEYLKEIRDLDEKNRLFLEGFMKGTAFAKE